MFCIKIGKIQIFQFRCTILIAMNIIQIIGVQSNEILSGIEGGVDSLDTDSRHLHLVLSKLRFHVTGKYIYNELTHTYYFFFNCVCHKIDECHIPINCYYMILGNKLDLNLHV